LLFILINEYFLWHKKEVYIVCCFWKDCIHICYGLLRCEIQYHTQTTMNWKTIYDVSGATAQLNVLYPNSATNCDRVKINLKKLLRTQTSNFIGPTSPIQDNVCCHIEFYFIPIEKRQTIIIAAFHCTCQLCQWKYRSSILT
jgi:hypothetical protein